MSIATVLARITFNVKITHNYSHVACLFLPGDLQHVAILWNSHSQTRPEVLKKKTVRPIHLRCLVMFSAVSSRGFRYLQQNKNVSCVVGSCLL